MQNEYVGSLRTGRKQKAFFLSLAVIFLTYYDVFYWLYCHTPSGLCMLLQRVQTLPSKSLSNVQGRSHLQAPHSVKSGSSNYAGTSMGRPATCLGRWKAEAAAWIVSCPNTRCMLHFLIRLHSENIISKINLLRISRRPPQSIKPMLRATFWDTACAWSPALVSYRLES